MKILYAIGFFILVTLLSWVVQFMTGIQTSQFLLTLILLAIIILAGFVQAGVETLRELSKKN